MTLIFSYFDGEFSSLATYIIPSLIFGIAMSLTLGHFHYDGLRDLGIYEPTEEELSVKPKCFVESNSGLSTIKDHIKNDKYFKRMKTTMTDDIIKISTGPSFVSWGENITILENRNESDYRYTITSKPKVLTQLIDGGKGMKNIIMLKKLIESIK